MNELGAQFANNSEVTNQTCSDIVGNALSTVVEINALTGEYTLTTEGEGKYGGFDVSANLTDQRADCFIP
jgi:hypothetical protein